MSFWQPYRGTYANPLNSLQLPCHSRWRRLANRIKWTYEQEQVWIDYRLAFGKRPGTGKPCKMQMSLDTRCRNGGAFAITW